MSGVLCLSFLIFFFEENQTKPNQTFHCSDWFPPVSDFEFLNLCFLLPFNRHLYRGGDGARTLTAGGSLCHYEEQGFGVFSGEFQEFLIQYHRPEIQD